MLVVILECFCIFILLFYVLVWIMKSDMVRGSKGVQINIKAVVITVIAIAIVLYAAYHLAGPNAQSTKLFKQHTASWRSRSFQDIPNEVKEKAKKIEVKERVLTFPVEKQKAKGSTKLPKQQTGSWRTTNFTDIPDEVKEKAKEIEVKESVLTFLYKSQEFSIYMRTAGAANKNPKFNVLLLHGAAFSSENWLKLNTLKLIAAMDINVVAIDLPGWAKSKTNPKLNNNDDKAKFLHEFIKHEQLDRPVIVSPSMSGSFAIPYLMGIGKHSPQTCHDRMRAFVPVAPGKTELYKASSYHQCEIPVMITYGSKDTGIGLTSVGNLRNMPSHEIMRYEGAGHPCYIDKPDEWHYNLYNFLLAVEREG